MDYSSFKTEVCKRRRSVITREYTKIAYSGAKTMITLAEGMPNEETFPFTEISIKLNDGSSFKLDERELGAALQYIPTQGYPPLLESLMKFQRRVHAPPLWESRDIVIVSGAQDGLSKTLEAIIGPGDPLLIQDPLYPGVEVVVAPYEAELIAIPQDEDGVVPEILMETLRKRQLSGKKMPKLMYLNATGSNPTGVTIPLDRRREIYRIACEYNFLILDDDPYHFMHFEETEPKSFLSMDTEGRVIRLDSFSKVISSGIRLGFITAATPLVESIEHHLQSCHLQASTLSQVILYKLLETWGYDKLMSHFESVRCFYKKRRDYIAALAEEHLSGLVDITLPRGGFFLWIKVRGVKDTSKMIVQRGIEEGILVLPGSDFMCDPSKPSDAIRLSYGQASYEEMDLAFKKLAKLIRSIQD
ncbi:kynurenine/alpha-aminoadipate aminotransferase, mitochondrial-like [Colletes gigas]|uniref:kynurenine/alpha-aminoadipate aminotransferase, mitochondrial-like n=1 Tax=Colletes gigas TaxID=935657 RepID=UPI001C9A58C0|nr:kynurenine/alpha-aminoadipate aminotransferase, mitochondrial-like [Colletes gigas]